MIHLVVIPPFDFAIPLPLLRHDTLIIVVLFPFVYFIPSYRPAINLLSA